MKNKIKLNFPLSLKRTLLGGQSFRWTENENDEFFGVFSQIFWKLSTKKAYLHYEVIAELSPDQAQLKPASKTNKYYDELLTSYFRLELDLNKYYDLWKNCHKHFASTSKQDAFITQLNQEVVENLFSFICSQNNHITRISSLVEKLCSCYGEKICDFQGKEIFAFPTLEALTKDENMEGKLRDLGFGYRAKFIKGSASDIVEKGGLKWLNELEKMEYHAAHDALMTLTGIGPKVADCICLMSLNFLEAIPVDTHIIQIASHYLPDLPAKPKSMTITLYRKIGDAFRNVYGDKAGMAQTVLFCNELARFKDNNVKSKVVKPRKKVKAK